jgi:hypothetical protein
MGQAQNQIFDGMDIYDWDGTKIGKVSRYDKKLGYFQTEGTFSGPRYIPISAVERVGPSGAYLNVPSATVKELYQHMPPVTPDVNAAGKLTGSAKVPSGYTGRPVPLDAEGLQLVREKITQGSKVFDAEGKKVGAVQAYDRESGYMRIEKGEVFTKDIFLPVTAISYLDDTGIHLSEAKDNIMNHFFRVPEVAQEFFAH